MEYKMEIKKKNLIISAISSGLLVTFITLFVEASINIVDVYLSLTESGRFLIIYAWAFLGGLLYMYLNTLKGRE